MIILFISLYKFVHASNKVSNNAYCTVMLGDFSNVNIS